MATHLNYPRTFIGTLDGNEKEQLIINADNKITPIFPDREFH